MIRGDAAASPPGDRTVRSAAAKLSSAGLGI
jgi:hypothetical protein